MELLLPLIPGLLFPAFVLIIVIATSVLQVIDINMCLANLFILKLERVRYQLCVANFSLIGCLVFVGCFVMVYRYRISLFSRWKQRGMYATCMWIVQLLLVLSKVDSLFIYIPEFYLETLVNKFPLSIGIEDRASL